MLRIITVRGDSVISFAAEELKKYLRMMRPKENDIEINYNPLASEGFRLGLFDDFGIEGEVEDARFDDYLYAKCDTVGGIIAGNNPRSVLLAVYEYLRRNGLRWLFPGPDGEYIPVKKIESVEFKIKPSCRYRGFANTTAASYQTNLEFIDFLPKVGMNTFMVEFRVPVFYTDNYYSHKRNDKNRAPEIADHTTILQWKRGTECEAARRGLVFHDVGHGFCIDAFGIDSCHAWYDTDESEIPEESRRYLAMVGGKRGFFGGVPVNTNFCMSNPEARRRVAKYVADYAEGHSNVDLLHVWLADGTNNHCECDECVRRTASDWYVELLNDIDEEMTKRRIDTKIVFLSYVDTSWAPVETFIKNRDRFVFMLAPFTRAYYDSIPKGQIAKTATRYERNKIYLAKTLEEFLAFYNDWRESFNGPAFAFEYHFCWNEYHDLSKFKHAELIHDEIVLYKKMEIDGVVEDGDMRCFLPNGLQLYTLARTLFDTSLSSEEIKADYMLHAYGKDFGNYEEVLNGLERVMEFAYFAKQKSENGKVSPYYSPSVAKRIEDELPKVIADGRKLVREHYNSSVRIETVSARLFEHYLDLCERLGKIIAKKAVGDDEGAKLLYQDFEDRFGKRECEIERYFNHCFFFNYLHYIVFDNASKTEFVL